MNIIFLGSGEFAAPALKILASTHHRISCVVTQPDRRKGRGLSVSGTPVKMTALEEGLKLYQPKNINAPEAIGALKELNPELLVVIAYGQILSPEVLNIPKIFAINLHASILPKYRGAAPINWAIIRGEISTGASIIKMTPRMDAGPIIMQEKIDIAENDNSVTLAGKLSDMGAHLLLKSLKAIEDGKFELMPQDEKEITFAPKLKKEDGLIQWDKPARQIYDLIRGCFGWPGAFTYYKGKLLKIYKAKVSSSVRQFESSIAGEIINISNAGITVTTGEGNLIIEELQIEGRRRMSSREFIAGDKSAIGKVLGSKKQLYFR